MGQIDADVLFSILHDRMKGAEEWITRAETDELKARAEGFLSALIEVKMSVADEVETTTNGLWLEREVIRVQEGFEMQSQRCSECGRYHTTPYMYYFNDYNYCPWCGSKMDGDGE